MRIAIIADIQGNAEALRAVLRDVARDPVSEIVSLGDLVGYNAQPREVIALLRERGVASAHGNHDLMAAGLLPLAGGPRARRGAVWTGEALSNEDRIFLRGLPGELERPGMLFFHTASGDRLKTDEQFLRQREFLRWSHAAVRICFTGHSAEPGVLEIPSSGRPVRHPTTGLVVKGDSFYFVNPGSVGEPRGPDDRATYALFDVAHGILSFRRVAYDRARVLRENYRRRLTVEPRPALARRVGARALAAARRLLGVPAGHA